MNTHAITHANTCHIFESLILCLATKAPDIGGNFILKIFLMILLGSSKSWYTSPMKGPNFPELKKKSDNRKHRKYTLLFQWNED